MSYSFSKRAATRVALMALIVAELDNVVAQQPIHSADRAQAQAAAESFLAIVPDADETQEFSISVNGSVGWKDGNVITCAAIGVSASLVAKEMPAA